MDGFERRKEFKKTNILDAALDLFMLHGVQKVSIAQIAKKANVSQVTIYNHFDSKNKLIDRVIIYYVDTMWSEAEQLLDSDIPFPDKIKKLIFNKKETANQIHPDFYSYFMREYGSGSNYIEEFYTEKSLPRMINLFNEGKEKGYIDVDLSNEAILFYIEMLKGYMQQEDIYEKILPLSEDITKLLFYGIVGERKD
ncbi:TetR/AcrR family transcriptional regulator [Aquibacillus saliphilus]|uniref:TetR/AcrR family transcriptional regulator n=1 Tax=Aquibacillus saliphilus TaxID=1909422 RepID=UPI001CEFFA1D